MSRWQISLDGPSSTTNDLIRGFGVYKKVMTSLELFKSEEIELNLVMCPLPQTLNVFEKEYKGFLEEISIRFPNVSVFLSADLREGRKIKRPSYQEREKWRKKI